MSDALYLNESPDGFAICGHDILVVSMHNLIALCPSMQVLWYMQVNLISVEVRIEGGAVGIVHADCPLPLHRPLLVLMMQSRCTLLQNYKC